MNPAPRRTLHTTPLGLRQTGYIPYSTLVMVSMVAQKGLAWEPVAAAGVPVAAVDAVARF